MRTVIKFIIFCVILLSFNKANAQLPNGVEYIEKLIKEFTIKLEKSEITGNGLLTPDWTANINTSLYGVSAVGTVNFHSGFVNSIGLATMNNQAIKLTVLEDYVEINSTFYFENVRVFFDMEIDLIDYSDLGSALINVPKVQYTVSLLYHYKTNVKTLGFYFPAVTSHLIESKLYPNNGYTQLIAKQMSSFNFYTPLGDSIKNGWNDSIQEKLDAIIATAANPEICYYCKELEI